jgi:hypothetical protein
VEECIRAAEYLSEDNSVPAGKLASSCVVVDRSALLLHLILSLTGKIAVGSIPTGRGITALVVVLLIRWCAAFNWRKLEWPARQAQWWGLLLSRLHLVQGLRLDS